MSVQVGIELQRLTKRFGEKAALSEVSLVIPTGQAFGLVGETGAGKSTALKLLVGMPPSEGQACVFGMNCVDARVCLRRRIGYAPETPFFYEYLKGWEVLQFAGEMHGLSGSVLNDTVGALLRWLEMSAAGETYVKQYSPKMKKKLAVGAALVHEPEVLLLDEPTAGLSEAEGDELAELLRKCLGGGRTVLLATESATLAEQVCDAVGILRDGRLVAVGSGGMEQRALLARRLPLPMRGASPSAAS